MTYATTSAELVQQLRLHQLNCAIVSEEALAEDRSSFATSLLFSDPMVLLVPAGMPADLLAKAFNRHSKPNQTDLALSRYVEISANVPMRSVSDAWYRAHLPFATPAFSAMTYVAAADIVAEGLATTHVPMSLLPSLPSSVRARLRIYALPDMDRSIVLAMPKHLMSLQSYANIFRRLADFCRNEYGRNLPADTVLKLPSSEKGRGDREVISHDLPSEPQRNFQ